MNDDLKDAIVLVTGAGGGIGTAICQSMTNAGARVIGTDIATRLAHLQQADYVCDCLELDVSSEAQWIETARYITSHHGRLDVLVNNAAVAPVVRLSEMSLESWRNCQAVNVDGMFLGLKHSLPLLVESGRQRQGGASVINMSSAGGLVAAPFNAAYCTSKGAVRMLTKAAAVEFSALGHAIRVNSVHPGCVQTEMMENIMECFVQQGQAPSKQDITEALNAAHPIGRMGDVREIANGVLFLASSASSFMHGTELVIDGGYTSR